MIWDFSKFGENTALVNDDNKKLTYENLNEEGAKLANAVGSRCLVFCLCTNTIGSVVGYTGFVNNRIVPLLLDGKLDMSLLTKLIDTYKPSYLWAPKGEKFNNMEVVYNNFNYNLYKTNCKGSYKLHDELALLLTTSGTTGSSKLVRQSYNNIKSNTRSIISILELDKDEKPITTLSMSYTYGLSIICSHLYVGAEILITDKMIISSEFWAFFKRNQATSFGGVPYTYEMLNKLNILESELPSLKTMTQSGGKPSIELQKKMAQNCAQNNRKLVLMYGATEATARMSYLPYHLVGEKIGSIGKVIPGGSLSLIDEQNCEIKLPEISGQLVFKGDSVTLGYATCGEDLSKGDENFGILKTGDIAKRDKDGYYYIVGRMSRFLKFQGNRVNLDEVESLIKKNISDADCACLGNDNNMHIFITDNKAYNEIEKLLMVKLGIKHASFTMHIIEMIPRNSSGKALYSKLKPLCLK